MTEDSNVRVSSDEASVTNDASQTRQRRKRKWDQPAESLVSAGITVPGVFALGNTTHTGGIAFPVVAPMSGALLTNPLAASSTVVSQALQAPSVQQDTAAAVQKLNQKIQDELTIAREIVINDAESSIRYKLTKRQTQEEIQRCTGAVVITRGKYRPPNAPPDGEKPLYLHISAGAHLKETAERILAVDRAAAMVEEMLRQGHNSQSISSTSHPIITNGVKVNQAFSTCVFLGFDADPSMDIVARIHGPNDQYINHIMNETGATVILRGCGSGSSEGPKGEDEQQPLHLFLSSNNEKSLEDAKRLAENLLDTISAECGASRVSSCKVYSAVPPPQQVYSAVPPPQQVYGVVSPSQQVYGAVPPPQQVYGASTLSQQIPTVISTPHLVYSAVPPPQHLSGTQSSGTELNVGSTLVLPASLVGLPDNITAPNPGTTLCHGQPQANTVGYASPSVSGATSYIGYGGIYPQVTPLQQVALALRQSPPVASTVVPTTSAPSRESKSTTSSDPDKEKRPPQKRKFQELPAGSKGSTKLNQGSEALKPSEQSDVLFVRNVSIMPPPKKLVQPSSNGISPPVPRNMPPAPRPKFSAPPPPPKFPAPPEVKVHDKDKSLKKTNSDTVPDTLVKLMEYGEDDDDIEDASEEPVGGNTPIIRTQKPFWAL
ncbi:hypothetical protein L6164_007543 [Bauhinia variegata]|uniref:Uncharacterized protein n=1 Tax=Bauhinia variegata TaxID=167791 RepID=A0ACB9PDR9_BAUVA|nr:hypothetical protein L6164_007543 [Bauhinia variegata]